MLYPNISKLWVKYSSSMCGLNTLCLNDIVYTHNPYHNVYNDSFTIPTPMYTMIVSQSLPQYIQWQFHYPYHNVYNDSFTIPTTMYTMTVSQSLPQCIQWQFHNPYHNVYHGSFTIPTTMYIMTFLNMSGLAAFSKCTMHLPFPSR